MTNGKGESLSSPASAYRVDIARAHSAAFNLDVDIVVTKRPRLELVLVEFLPRFRAIDLETSEVLGVRHSGNKDV
jgi:hypothetical protein